MPFTDHLLVGVFISTLLSMFVYSIEHPDCYHNIESGQPPRTDDDPPFKITVSNDEHNANNDGLDGE